LFVEWWFVPLIRLGKTGRRYLAPDLHHPVDIAPDLHVARAPGRDASVLCQRDTPSHCQRAIHTGWCAGV